MADFFYWNNKASLGRKAIDAFLSRAEGRVDQHPDALPFKQADAKLVISWLRALADRKPSELDE